MKRKRKLIFLYLSVTLSLVAVFIVISSLFLKITINSLSENINIEYIAEEDVLPSDKADVNEEEKIKNIALFGIDSRENDDIGRSDAVMIASFNLENGDIKLISIARDTYVEITE